MALINKIREKSGVTIGIITLALASFLVGGDLLSPGSKLLGNDPTDVGIIEGTEVDYVTMQREIDMLVTQTKNQTGKNPTQAQIKGLENDAWNRMVFKYAYKPNFKSLGIIVSKEERDDMLAGKNIHPSLKQSFVDPNTQQFNKEQLVQYVRIFDGNNAPEGMDPQDFSFRKRSWETFKTQIPDDRMQNKYVSLLTKSAYVTKKEAEKSYKNTSTQANIRYVYVPYYSITDSTIEVTDAQLNAYLKNNSGTYQSEATRAFDYISFPIVASVEDTAIVREELEEIVVDFKEAVNDTIFIRQYSDNPQIPTSSTKAQVPLALQNAQLDSGYVSDIVIEGGNLVVYKVTNISEDTTFSVKASHILVKWDSDSEEDKAKAKLEAKAILSSVKGGADFAELAKEKSKDLGSGAKGGDLGWFGEGQMVPSFNDAAFGMEGTGLVSEIVESQFGYHIINVTEPKTNVSYTISKIERVVYASEVTKDDVYRKVGDFLAGVSNTNDFVSKAESDPSLQKFSSGNVSAMDQYLKGIGEARSIIRWAFNQGDDNEVSKVLTMDNAYVVAALTDVNDKGTSDLESVREEVAIKVRNAEKAKQIIEKLDVSKSLDEIASSYGEGVTVKTANALNLSSTSIDGIGFDPKAVGSVFGLTNGMKSAAIEGENGVIVIEMIALTEAASKEDYSAEKAQLLQGLQTRSGGGVFQALKELVDVEDNRVRYY